MCLASCCAFRRCVAGTQWTVHFSISTAFPLLLRKLRQVFRLLQPLCGQLDSGLQRMQNQCLSRVSKGTGTFRGVVVLGFLHLTVFGGCSPGVWKASQACNRARGRGDQFNRMPIRYNTIPEMGIWAFIMPVRKWKTFLPT